MQASRSAAGGHWQSVLKALVELYDAWHAAEPDALTTGGTPVPQKAAEWRGKLGQFPNAETPKSQNAKTQLPKSQTQPVVEGSGE